MGISWDSAVGDTNCREHFHIDCLILKDFNFYIFNTNLRTFQTVMIKEKIKTKKIKAHFSLFNCIGAIKMR